jgi:hypothetical protein
MVVTENMKQTEMYNKRPQSQRSQKIHWVACELTGWQHLVACELIGWHPDFLIQLITGAQFDNKNMCGLKQFRQYILSRMKQFGKKLVVVLMNSIQL